jgi:hypothetical protein
MAEFGIDPGLRAEDALLESPGAVLVNIDEDHLFEQAVWSALADENGGVTADLEERAVLLHAELRGSIRHADALELRSHEGRRCRGQRAGAGSGE